MMENIEVSMEFARRINAITSKDAASFLILGAEFIVMRRELFDNLVAASKGRS